MSYSFLATLLTSILLRLLAGDRIQLHRNGNNIQYYSRRGVEHGEYSGFTVMDAVVKKQLKHDKCILDGEMIVWNKTK